MKLLNRKAIAAAVMVPAMLITPVMAAEKGQVEGGDIFRVKNVTDNQAWGDPINADKCETVSYMIRIHNPGPSPLTNVNVKASIASGASTKNVSTAMVSSDSALPKSASDSATINLSTAQRVQYVTGTTQLLDHNGNVIKTLPDGITAGGVNIGTVGVSLNEKRFVKFTAKVDCPTTTTEVPKTPETPAVAQQPTTLPETGGPAAGLAAVAGSGALGYAVMAYRRSKRALADKLLNR